MIHRVILEYDGDTEDFKKAMDSMDDSFDLNDSIFYMLDYEPNSVNVHSTDHGFITLKYEQEDK